MGQEIGKTGSTGMSTGEHLHFQIDRASAPFHPYWPFSFKEARDLGLGFMEAVNR
jgi:murein DD-endopeptidase MepM/ murein hydrolase activator NlpD